MSISAWLHQLDFSYLLTLLLSAAAALLCITVHESAHGLIAAALGDPTAKRAGRISLNPFKHVDFLGLRDAGRRPCRLGKAGAGGYAEF